VQPVDSARERRHLRVTGVVQGVGFRPFVYRLARSLELGGFVGNDSGGVFIEVEGTPDRLDGFVERLGADAPPASRIATIRVQERDVREQSGFEIVPSRDFARAQTLVSPDLTVCDACLAEISDPADRRHGYAFTNCTDCGPRYTIIESLPYDRPRTTMAAFAMCEACQQEYEDPADRRFHAQPNACPGCGPNLRLDRLASAGAAVPDESGDLGVLRVVLSDLDRGDVVALKGLGGFHLACDATQIGAVRRLRERKGRPAKPLALMVPDLTTAALLCRLDEAARALLVSTERPIVLAPWRRESRLAGVAPGNADVGIMLPYTPMHALLLRLWHEHRSSRNAGSRPTALVMTSANRSGEPIVKDDDEARAVLAGIADALVVHDRAIHVRADDSVMTSMVGRPVPIRRSRGYAPYPVPLPREVRPTLGVGGELKSTFCFAAGSLGFLSPHIGDMENLETLEAFEAAADHFQALFGVEPEVVVCDAHPGYLSSGWARRRWPQRTVEAQHHHAHVASLMAEHGSEGDEPLLGIAFDGTGYGADGAIWGGEVLIADYRQSRRAAHLAYVPLPGGDLAVRRPYRHALSLLRAAGVPWRDTLAPVRMCRPSEAEAVAHQIATGLASPLTSSMGRLFDAVAALLGLCEEVTYEGEAAIRLEALARDASPESRYAFELGKPSPEGPWVLDPSPVVRDIVADLAAGAPPDVISAAFHQSVSEVRCMIIRRFPLSDGQP
jgi:hydrogenase maturation protein HypF